jgi:hypothetical protein
MGARRIFAGQIRKAVGASSRTGAGQAGLWGWAVVYGELDGGDPRVPSPRPRHPRPYGIRASPPTRDMGLSSHMGYGPLLPHGIWASPPTWDMGLSSHMGYGPPLPHGIRASPPTWDTGLSSHMGYGPLLPHGIWASPTRLGRDKAGPYADWASLRSSWFASCKNRTHPSFVLKSDK